MRLRLHGIDWRANVLLAAGLAAVFLLTGYDRGQFYRGTEHDGVSRHHLAVAANLSAEHGFAQFRRLHFDADGELTYHPYHRFPLLGYVLIKLVGLPFGDDLSARLFAARMLVLAFFAGAMVLAYLSLRRLTGPGAGGTALAATLLAFSSYPLLYHSDIVTPEAAMGLFSVLLALHGVAVYLDYGHGPGGDGAAAAGSIGPVPSDRFGQLCAKTCVAFLLDWHVCGLLLPLLLVALPHAVYSRDWRRCRHWALLGVAALLTGLTVLAFNLAREHHALGGGTPVFELPTLESMLRRAGVTPLDPISWGGVLHEQLRRVGEAALPWALAAPLEGFLHGRWHWLGGACLALAGAVICLPGTRHRIAWSGLALCGMGWALPMRHQVQEHEFEVLFQVGAPLAVWALVLARLREFAQGRGAGRPLRAGVAAMAFVLFVASVWLMGRVGDDAETRARERAFLADVQAIRRHTEGKVVYVPWAVLDRNACCKPVHLTGSVMVTEPTPRAEFVVATNIPRSLPGRLPAVDSPAGRSLTPDNQVAFLYEADAYRTELRDVRGVYEQRARQSRAAIDSAFRVYHMDDALLYVGEGQQCRTEGRRAKFFLHVVPQDVGDLPEHQRRIGFANLDFHRDRNWLRDGRCFALRFLPDWPIAEIRTGQFVKRYGFRPLWEGWFKPSSHPPGRPLSGTP